MSAMEELHEKQALNSLSGSVDTISQPKDPETEVCFKYFSKLPKEIRLMIWELAIPVRVIHTNSSNPFKPSFGLVHKAPQVAHACYESRQLALQTGRMNIPPNPQNFPKMCFGPTIAWFDIRRDTFCANFDTCSLDCYPLGIEKVVLRYTKIFQGDPKRLGSFMWLPNLKSVHISIECRFIPTNIFRTWVSLRGLEGTESAIIDLDDEEEVYGFGKMLRNHSEWQYSYWVERIRCLRNMELYVHGMGEPWEVVRKLFQEKWTEDHKEVAESARCCQAKMPKFSRVLLLEPYSEEEETQQS
ncbi:hypothetical protein F4859DRAFT_394307 [Xylaria cf. heliscus]|nr:hypothetical protein F4859DRAFT_394307 [Xylaria cf. heliscus]